MVNTKRKNKRVRRTIKRGGTPEGIRGFLYSPLGALFDLVVGKNNSNRDIGRMEQGKHIPTGMKMTRQDIDLEKGQGMTRVTTPPPRQQRRGIPRSPQRLNLSALNNSSSQQPQQNNNGYGHYVNPNNGNPRPPLPNAKDYPLELADTTPFIRGVGGKKNRRKRTRKRRRKS